MPDSIESAATSITSLCHAIGARLAAVPEHEGPAALESVLSHFLAMPDLLRPDQMTLPEDGYGRHDVFVCPQDMFSVIAAVWPPGYTSPIHDHLTWCTFGVYRGVIVEDWYEPLSGGEGSSARPVRTFEHLPGSVNVLPSDAPDIHSMHNPTDKPAVSVHIYGGNSLKLGPNVETVYTHRAER